MIHAVTRDPRTALSRLRRMSWDEVHVRLGQELGKRIDWASYRLGLSEPPTVKLSGGLAGNFFFAPDEVSGRVQCIKEALPEEAASLVRRAGAICSHRFDLLGYRDLNYGPIIDWHRDAVSGKSTPLQPWFKIRFLDYEAAGDHKVIWELNRHQHLVTLARAWSLTGNNEYVDEIVSQWNSWQEANPYPLGINWASSLEIAFRSLSWLWILGLLANCSRFPHDFRAQMMSALCLNGRHIERYLSTYFSPNTHLLGEAVALFFIGLLGPQVPAAARWKNKGWQILLQEAEHQVRPDGVYFEQSLYYHVYALDFFLHARVLAARNGISIPPSLDETIGRMLDVVRSLGQTGVAEGFGDDDGGRVFDPQKNRAECLTDPLAIGATLYGFEGPRPVTEEAIWLFGKAAVKTQNQAPTRPALLSRSFADGGIYIMGSPAVNMQLVIDAGPQGTGRCGHGHADALSLSLPGRGRRWLVESGAFRYISASGERAEFRGTSAHNTLRVDHLDQAVPEGPFAWSSLPQVKADRWVVGESFDFFEGSHNGYARLSSPVIHRRFVFSLKDKFWLVRDVAEGTGRHDLEIFWHFASDLNVRHQDLSFIAQVQAEHERSADLSLVLQTTADPAWAKSLGTASVSPVYGVTCPAPVLSLSASAQLPADCAVLLIPQLQSAVLGDFSALPSRESSSARGYRYQSKNEDHYFFFAEPGRPWACAPWRSDAAFLHCAFADGRLMHLVQVDSTFCTWQDNEIVALRRRTQSFEWLLRDGRVITRSSDMAAVRHSLTEELVCSDPVT